MSVPATPVPPPLGPQPMDERQRELERKKERRLIWLIVGGALALLVLFAVGLFAVVQHLIGSAEPVQAALREVNQCLPCRKAIGTPIERGWFFMGQVNWSGTGGNADLRIPVEGPRGSGTLRVQSLRTDGVWRFVELILSIPAKDQTITLWHEGENVTPTGDNVVELRPQVAPGF